MMLGTPKVSLCAWRKESKKKYSLALLVTLILVSLLGGPEYQPQNQLRAQNRMSMANKDLRVKKNEIK